MSERLVNLDIGIRGDTTSLDTALQKSEGSVAGFKDAIGKSSAGVEGAFSNLGKSNDKVAALNGSLANVKDAAGKAASGVAGLAGGLAGVKAPNLAPGLANAVPAADKARSAVEAIGQAFAGLGKGSGLSSTFSVVSSLASAARSSVSLVGSAFSGLGTAAKGSSAAAGEGMAGIGSAAGMAGGAVAGVVGVVLSAVKAAITTIKDLTQQGIEYISQLSKVAQRLGTTNAGLAGLQHAAVLSGLGIDELTHGLQHLQRSISEAATSGGEAAAALNKMQLNAQELNELTTEQQLAKVADGLKNITIAGDRTRISMQLFGRGGAEMIDIMKHGADGLQKFQQQASALGLGVSAAQAQAVRNVGSSWRLLGEQAKGIGATMAVAFAPMVEWINDKLGSALGWLNSKVQDSLPYWNAFSGVVSAFFGMLREMMQPVLDAVGAAFSGINQWLRDNGIKWEELKEKILQFTFGTQFVLENWADSFGLVFDKAYLKIVQFGNNIEHFFTTALPRLLKGQGWTEAFERLPTDFENELMENLKAKEEELDERFQWFVNQKMDEFGKKAAEDVAPKGIPNVSVSQKPKAAELGSVEAFSILANTGKQEDKVWRVATDQLMEAKNANKLLAEMIKLFGGNVIAPAKL